MYVYVELSKYHFMIHTLSTLLLMIIVNFFGKFYDWSWNWSLFLFSCCSSVFTGFMSHFLSISLFLSYAVSSYLSSWNFNFSVLRCPSFFFSFSPFLSCSFSLSISLSVYFFLTLSLTVFPSVSLSCSLLFLPPLFSFVLFCPPVLL